MIYCPLLSGVVLSGHVMNPCDDFDLYLSLKITSLSVRNLRDMEQKVIYGTVDLQLNGGHLGHSVWQVWPEGSCDIPR